jgi:ABC-type nitrate/sulfonate/bicarbonate transport system permease component
MLFNIKTERLSGFILVIGLVCLWEIYSRFNEDFIFLPPFTRIIGVFINKLFDIAFLKDIGLTLGRCFIGYIIANFLMIPSGIIMGRNILVYNLFEPLIEFFRPMPSAAIIPIAILFLGIGDEMKLFVIFFGSCWPILINTIEGVRGVDPMYVKTGLVFNFTSKEILYKIIFPASLPSIFTGMRISIAIALILTITVEMISGGSGIGYYILDAERSFHFAEMYTGVLTIGILGYLINWGFLSFENKILNWYKQSKKLTN